MKQAERLKKLLLELDVNQAAFARALGISKGQITNILNGEREISNILALAITAVYPERHIDPTWLLTGEGEMFLAGNAKKPTVFYDAENQTFADEDGSFVSGKEAKKAYEAYLARSGKSPVSADSISLEGLDESEKAHVINTVKILQDAKKKKGK